MLTGAKASGDSQTILRALSEISCFIPGSARWAQDKAGAVGVLFKVAGHSVGLPQDHTFASPGSGGFAIAPRPDQFTFLGTYLATGLPLGPITGMPQVPVVGSTVGARASNPATCSLADALKNTKISDGRALRDRAQGPGVLPALTSFYQFVGANAAGSACKVVEGCLNRATDSCGVCGRASCLVHRQTPCSRTANSSGFHHCNFEQCRNALAPSCSHCKMWFCPEHAGPDQHACVSSRVATSTVCCVLQCLLAPLLTPRPCGCLSCDQHMSLACSHTQRPTVQSCGVPGCETIASTQCGAPPCTVQLCDAHSATPCPHLVKLKGCYYGFCVSPAVSICSHEPSCGVHLCAHHAGDNFPCPHEVCHYCAGPASTACTGKCDKPLCALHRQISCHARHVVPKGLAKKWLCKAPHCTKRCAGTCPFGCGLPLCSTHMNTDCPHPVVPSAPESGKSGSAHEGTAPPSKKNRVAGSGGSGLDAVDVPGEDVHMAS